MQNQNNLVDGKYGHGAKLHSKLRHKLHRFLRNDVGQSAIPFDWSKGVSGQLEYNIKNQFQSSSCGGQMVSRMIQIIKGGEELSAKSFYSTGFAQGGGMILGTVEDQVLNTGITTEAKVPSQQNENCTEQFMEDTSWRTNALIQDEITRAGLQVLNVNIDIDSIASAIRDYKCVGWLIRGQNNGSWSGLYPTPPTSNLNLWGHYMCSSSNVPAITSDGIKRTKWYQSWGTSVGDNGFQYFGSNYIDSGYIVDVFTFVPFTFQNNLSIGMTSPDVKQLQIRLNKLGFTVSTSGAGSLGHETNFFGPATFSAVRKYQTAHNIFSIGIVGPQTRFSLNAQTM